MGRPSVQTSMASPFSRFLSIVAIGDCPALPTHLRFAYRTRPSLRPTHSEKVLQYGQAGGSSPAGARSGSHRSASPMPLTSSAWRIQPDRMRVVRRAPFSGTA